MSGIRMIKAIPALDKSADTVRGMHAVEATYMIPMLRRAAMPNFVRRLIWTFHRSTIGKRPRTQSQIALTTPWMTAERGTMKGFMQKPSAPSSCFQKYDGGRH